MKRILVSLAAITMMLSVAGQNWNPYISNANISTSPLLPAEFNGSAELSFVVGNSGTSTLTLVAGQEMTLIISLSDGVPNNINPIAALGGTWLSYFTWSYDPFVNTYIGIQNQNIPAGPVSGNITIQYAVLNNSPQSISSNGFNVNLQPPPYSNGTNSTLDDAASTYTYVKAQDYGDAPLTYGTAVHEIDVFKSGGFYTQYIYLGSSVDPESSYNASALADGDDLNGSDDEDGVTIPSLQQGATVSIPVTVTAQDASFGYLYAWIDWNADGDFLDAGEQINSPFTFFAASATVNLSVTVPMSATVGASYARFRIGDMNGSPSAASLYGEVEDYQVFILGSTPSLSLTKSASHTSNVPAGQVITYTYQVTNTGNVALSNVSVADIHSGTGTLSAITPASVASLAIGASTNFTATYTVTQADIDAQANIVNTATATGFYSGTPYTDTDNEVVDVANASPSINLVKTGTYVDNPPLGVYNPGDQITYSFSVTNTGNVTLTGVSISDPLVTISGGPIASLAPGASDNSTFTATKTLTQVDIDAGTFTNTATVTGTPPSGPPVTDTDDDDKTFAQVKSIELQKTGTPNFGGDGIPQAGETITYAFTVTNTGNVTLTSIIVSDPLVTVTGGPLATLAPGASNSTTFTATYTLTQANINSGTFTNTATVTGTPPSGPPVTDDDNDTQPLTQVASIVLIKTGTANFGGDGIPQVGETISYAFSVTNTGNVTLSNVAVTDPLVTVTGGPLATLAPGATNTTTFTASYTLTQSDINAGSFTNTATVSGNPPSGPPVNDTDDDTQPLSQTASINLVKTGIPNFGGDALPQPGETITYSFTVTNTGNVTLTNVMVSDPTVTIVGGPILSLAPGASDNTTFTATHVLTQANINAGTFSNTASVSGTPPIGPPVSDTDDDIQALAQNPSIALIKFSTLIDNPPLGVDNAGDQISYAFTVTNTGNVTLTNVTVTDILVSVSGGPIPLMIPGAVDNTTFTALYTITQADIDFGSISNQALTTGTPPSGPNVTDLSDDGSNLQNDPTVMPVSQNPGISIVKSSTTMPNTFTTAGNVLTYDLLVTNTGNVTLTNVIVSDPIATVSGSPIASLAPGASVTLTASYTVIAADIASGFVLNTASVSGTPPSGPPVTDTDNEYIQATQNVVINDVTVNENAGTATFTVTLSGGVPGGFTLDYVTANGTALNPGDYLTSAGTLNFSGIAGETVTITVPITDDLFGEPTELFYVNLSNVSSPNVVIADPQGIGTILDDEVPTLNVGDATVFEGTTLRFPITLTNPSSTPVTFTPSLSNITAIVGTDVQGPYVYSLDAGVTWIPWLGGDITIPAGVTSLLFDVPSINDVLAESSETFLLTATVTSGNTGNLSDTGLGTILDNDAASVAVNDIIVNENDGTATLTVTLTGSIQDALSVDWITSNGSALAISDYLTSSGTLTFPAGSTSGTTLTITIPITDDNVMEPTEAFNVTLSNIVSIATFTSISDPLGIVTILDNEVAAINLAKTGTPNFGGDGIPQVGETITYSFTVTNTGNVTLTNITVSDPLVTVTGGPLATLAPGASNSSTFTATYTLTQANINAGTFTNTATTTGTPPSGPPVTDDDDDTQPLNASPSILLAKTGTPNFGGDGIPQVGETITYSFTVTNTGNVTLTNITVTDPLVTVTGGPLATLAPGASNSSTFTATYTLTQANINAGTFTNTATTTGTPPSGPPVTDDDDDTQPLNASPSILLAKTGTPNFGGDGIPQVGETITYSFTVTNTGNVTLTNITVSDPLVTVTGGPLATLAPGASNSSTFTATYTLTQANINAGTFTNTATTTGTPPSGPPVTDDDDDTQPLNASPSILLAKTGTPNFGGDGIPQVGETITYSFTVTNTGNVTLTNITVSDPLVTVTGGPLATLAPGASNSSTFTATYTLTQANINAGTFTNTATTTGTPPSGPPVTDDDDDTQPLNASPSILLAKTGTPNFGGDGIPQVGETITYSFTVTNTGNVTLTNITVSDPLVTVTGGPLATLAPGASNSSTFTATYTLTQANINASTFTNTATTTGTPPSGPPVTDDDDDTQPLNASPSILLAKTGTPNFGGDGIPQVGETITYSFTVTNTGNVTLTNITVSDPLVTVTGGPLATLAPGASNSSTFTATYTLTQANINAGTFTNTATATGTPPSGPPVTDDDDDTQPLNASPSILLAKTGTPNFGGDGIPQVGETITYSFTVTNTGNVTLTNITVSDPLVTVTGGPLATLAPGASNSSTFTATYTLTQANINAGTFTNTATTTGTPPSGPPVTDDDDDTQPLNASPSILLAKTGTPNFGGDGIPQVGETITYSFTVTNTGNVTLTNITVSDPLVTVTGGPLATLAPGASNSSTFTATYTLTQANINAGTFTNTATTTGTPPSGPPVTDDDDDTQPLNASPSILLAKTGTPNFGGDGIPQVGETISYSFTVTNTGNVTLTNITVSDPLVTVTGGPLATLAPGASNSSTFTATYTLTQANINAGTFTNTATTTGTPPSGPPVTDDDDDTQPLNASPSILLAKNGTPNFGGDGIPQVGETITYSFTVTNTGNVTLTNITVSDPLVTVTGGPLATLAPGASNSSTFTATYTLTQANINAGTFTNTATATGTPPSGPPVTDDDDDTQPLNASPSILLAKTGTPNFGGDGIPQVGETITYSFTVTNTGNVTLTNITVSDPLVTVTGGPLATLAPGASNSSTFTATYTLTQANINAGTFTNTATATGTPPSGPPVTDDDDDTQPLNASPSILLAKTGTPNFGGDGIPQVGETITYSFTVTNTGNVTLTNITVSDPLVTVTGGPLATLAPGASNSSTFTATYVLTQANINAGTFTNTATATGTPPSGPPVTDDDDDTQPLNASPSILLAKTGTPNFGGDGIPQVGETITYSFTVTNTGNVTLTNITVSDPLVTVTGGPLATLAPGASNSSTFTATYTLTQANINAGTFTNTATATGTPPSGPPVTDDDDDTQPLNASPSILLAKTGTPNFGGDGIPQVGETITYSFTVTNTGNVTLTNITVSDPLVTVTGGPLATLAPGASNSSTFTATYTLTQANINAGTFTNTATTTGTPPSGPPVTDDDDDTQPLNASPSILLAKTGTPNFGGDGIPQVGETITYSFTVTNTGNVTLTNITVSDPLVTVTGGPLATLAPGASNSSTFTATYTLTQANINAGTFTNTATATGTPPSGPPVTDDDDDTQPLNASPSILLAKTGTPNFGGDGIPQVGETITYSFTVTNTGNVTLTNITVSDPLVTVTGGPLATLAPGASNSSTFTATYTLTQANINAGTFTNTATATGTPPSGPPVTDDDDDTQPLSASPSILLAKTGTPNFGGDGIPQVGETITYSFTLTNTGNVTLTNITVSDPLVTVTGGPLATLAPGASNSSTFTATYTLTQANINAGTFTNTATATGTPPSGPPVTDDDDDTQPLSASPSILLAKTGTPNFGGDGIPQVGETITYSFTVTNTGNVTLTNITVSDPLVTVTGGPLATLAPGASDNTTFTATYVLTQANINAGTFTNTATATGNPPSGPPVTDDDDDTQPLLVPPAIAVGDAIVMEGNTLSFLITLSSASTTPVTFTPSLADITASVALDTQLPIQYSTDGGLTWTTWISGDITMPSGITSLIFNVPTLNDNLAESNETLSLTATVTSANTINPSDTGIGTILDNDAVSVAINDVVVNESDGTATLTLTLTGSIQDALTVFYGSSDASALSLTDYSSVTGSVAFPAGSLNGSTLTITIPITDDLLAEPTELFNLNLNSLSSSAVNASISDPLGTVTILDDDLPVLSIGDVLVMEGNTLSFPITLSNPSSTPVVFTPSLADITAQVGVDTDIPIQYSTDGGTTWTVWTSGSIIIPAGVTGVLFNVPTLNDAIGEPTETLSLTATVSSGNTVNPSATGIGTILDNDLPIIAVGDASIIEGNTLSFPITLSNPSSTPVVFIPSLADITAQVGIDTDGPIQYTTDGGATWITWVSGSITIPVGVTSIVFNVPTVNDILPEISETLSLTATVISNNTSNLSDTGIGTILDNDTPAFVVGDATVIEGNTLSFPITLGAPSVSPVVFTPSLNDITAQVGVDTDTPIQYSLDGGLTWTVWTSGSITIPAGITSVLFNVPTLNDPIGEPTETLLLTATVSSGNTSNVSDTGIGTILDDDTPAIAVGDVTVMEGNTLSFPITLSSPSATPVVFTPNLTDITAQVGVDTDAPIQYSTDGGLTWTTWTAGPITIPAGLTTVLFNVPTLNDVIGEISETLNLNVSVSSGNTSNVSAIGIGTILDNDPVVLQVGDFTVFEGSALYFPVTLSNPSSTPVVFIPSLTDISALVGVDTDTPIEYSTDGGLTWIVWVSGPVSIPAGVTLLNFRVPSVNDPLSEPTETFSLTATITSGNTANASDSGIGTILDNDLPAIVVGDALAIEGNILSFPISLSNASSTPVTFTPSLADITAQVGVDTDIPIQFSLDGGLTWTTWTSGPISIPAGVTTLIFNVPTLNDAIGEVSETLSLTATVNSGNTSNPSDSGIGTILDNDTPALAVGDATVFEGNTLSFAITLSAPSTSPVVFTPSLSNITAQIGVDTDTPIQYSLDGGLTWTTWTAGSITIPAGLTSVLFNVPTVNDIIGEPTETLLLTASVSSGNTSNLSDTGLGTILDNDLPILSVGDAIVTEGNTLTFPITLSNPSSTPVVFTPSLTDITAQIGVDTDTPIQYSIDGGLTWVNWAIGSITLPAGVTSLLFNVPSINDVIAEPTETFSITATVNSGNTANASDDGIGTILDNDSVLIAVGDAIVIEGNTLSFPITLSNPSSSAVVFVPSLADITAQVGVDTDTPIQYSIDGGLTWSTWVSGSIVIPAGVTSLQFNVPTLNDPIGEPTETLSLTATVTSGNTNNVSDTGIGTILDDDTPVLSVGDAAVVEGNTLSFPITLSAPSATPVIFTPSLADITAQVGVDTDTPIQYSTDGGLTWTTWISGSITIPAGIISVVFNVPSLNDAIGEPTETFNLTATVSSGNTSNLSDTGLGTIYDNDTPALSVGDVTVWEGNVLSFPITLSAPSATPVVFTPSLADITAQVGIDTDTPIQYSIDGGLTWTTWVSGSITIPSGVTSLLFNVPTINDAISELTETLSLTATVSSGNTSNVSDTGTGTILDNDVPSINIGDATVFEGTALVFPVTLSIPSTTAVTFTPSFSDITAQVGVDTDTPIKYSLDGGLTWITWVAGPITMPAGTTLALIRVPTVNDVIAEPSESFTAAITVSSGNTTNATDTGLGTILDNDLPSINVGDATVVEGNTLSFPITLSNPSSTPVVFTPSLADITAQVGVDTQTPIQYSTDGGVTWTTWTAGNITIPAGVTTVLFNVPTTNDAIGELSETLSLTATVTSGNTVNPSDSGIGTITDNDTPAIAIGNITVVEGNVLSFPITLSNASATPVVFTPTLADITAQVGVDTDTPILYSLDGGLTWITWASGSITIPAGVTSMLFNVPSASDAIGEPNETFSVTVTVSSGNTSNPSTTGIGTILDNDIPVISVGDHTVVEGNTLSFPITLSNPSSTPVVFVPSLASITATVGIDTHTPIQFSLDGGLTWTTWVGGTITIPAGVTSVLFNVPSTNDVLAEGTETLTLTATVASGNTANPSATGVGTILDNDVPSITVGDATVLEGNTLSFPITLSNASATPVSFTPSFSDITAQVGVDTDTPVQYSIDGGLTWTIWVSGPISFPAGVTSILFNVPSANDIIAENTETFNLTAIVLSGNTSNISDSGLGTILDNDAVSVAINDVTVNENAGTATLTITLTGSIQSALSVDYTTADGTALSTTDYSSLSGTVSFPAGSVNGTTITITIPITDDFIPEATELFYVNLSNIVSGGASASISDPQGVVTILDDDSPSLSIVKTSTTVPNNYDAAGDILTYQIVVTNTGNVPLSSIVVTDPLTGLNTTIALLGVGASQTFNTSYIVTQADVDAGSVLNVATATTTVGGLPITDTDPETIPALQSPSLSLLKLGTYVDTDNNGFTNAGDQITYVFVVTNTGNVTISNIVIVDPLVAVVGGPILVLAPGASDNTTFTAVYTITAADITAGSFLNTAWATGTSPLVPVITSNTSSDLRTFTNILPVSWLSFDATIDGDEVALNWKTASEINNSHFEVYRRHENETQFSKIGLVAGSGNSTVIKSYDYTDVLNGLPSGVIYYQLRQVDFDGKFEWSSIRRVHYELNLDDQIVVYPSPSQGEVNIDLSAIGAQVQIELYNSIGQLIMSRSRIDESIMQFDLSYLPAGIYHFRVSDGSQQITKQIVLQK
jgi:uncharacterized repeat protein (TIGR01451 family)